MRSFGILDWQLRTHCISYEEIILITPWYDKLGASTIPDTSRVVYCKRQSISSWRPETESPLCSPWLVRKSVDLKQNGGWKEGSTTKEDRVTCAPYVDPYPDTRVALKMIHQNLSAPYNQQFFALLQLQLL